jgi:hypothetical protein
MAHYYIQEIPETDEFYLTRDDTQPPGWCYRILDDCGVCVSEGFNSWSDARNHIDKLLQIKQDAPQKL